MVFRNRAIIKLYAAANALTVRIYVANHEWYILFAFTTLRPCSAHSIFVSIIAFVLIPHDFWRSEYPSVNPLWGGPFFTLDNRAGLVHSVRVGLAVRQSVPEQHQIPLIGLEPHPVHQLAPAHGPGGFLSVRIQRTGIWEDGLTAQLRGVQEHQRSGDALPLPSDHGLQESVLVRLVLLADFVVQNLQSLSVGDGQHRELGDALLYPALHLIAPTIKKHPTGGADVVNRPTFPGLVL
mmetsp:Transcript_23904/g.32875  ORF Transcript_23904/g.32875 Transcript_23904/m.32875 type:complete len:237 (-) Transcript_23904:646-1356(-)